MLRRPRSQANPQARVIALAPKKLNEVSSSRPSVSPKSVLARAAIPISALAYRHAATRLGLEPAECLMVSANSFDVLGARACGFRAAFVNRGGLPYEDSPLQPELTVPSFTELADALL